jgi:hypothetical protein
MKFKNFTHLKKIVFLLMSMFLNMGAEAQAKNFEYVYGNANGNSDVSKLKVLKDKSILTCTSWWDSSSHNEGSCIHKLSSDGKLLWKTILECKDAFSEPTAIDELADGSIVCLLSNYYGGFYYTSELVRLDKNGSIIKSVGFSDLMAKEVPAAIVVYNNNIYTVSNSLFYDEEILIQKYDTNLRQISSVTIADLQTRDMVIHNDNLLLLCDQPTVLGATLLALDTNLTVMYAKQYEINDDYDTYQYANKIIVDQGNPIISGYYISLDSGIAQQYYIYPDNLSASGSISGDNNIGFNIVNDNIYVVGEDTGDAFIAKYDLKSGEKKWTNVYGGDEDELFRNIIVSENQLYASGRSLSFGAIGTDYTGAYIVKADTSGENTCSKSNLVHDINFKNLSVVESDFPYVTRKSYLPFSNKINAISSVDYYDTITCSSAPTSIARLNSTTDIEVYPTVTSGIVNLNHVDVLNGSSYQLVNINGQVMMTGKLKYANNSIDISNLSDALYLLRVLDEKTKAYSTFKIVKQSN